MSEPQTDHDDALAPEARPGSRWRIGLGAALVLVLVGIGVAVISALLNPGGKVLPVGAPSSDSGIAVTSAPTPSASASRVIVHVLGQVKEPGVYELDAGSRAIDAVSAAGGFTAAADRTALNLARVVGDGEQLFVPKPGEAPPAAADAATAGGTSGGAGAGQGSKVDLNTATLEQLETLPRIGPSLAQRILDWRAQNGRFASVDDLTNVAGIGDKTFADLKELVTAG